MDDGLMLCRAFHFTASLLVFGTLVFQDVLAPKKLATFMDPVLRRSMVACAAVAAATAVVWLLLLSATIGESWSSAVSPDMVGSVLLHTQFGAVWQWHMGLSFGAVALVWYDRCLPEKRRRPVTGLVVTLQVATLGLVGHAVMPAGVLGLASRATQVLHLIAAGFWLGSLVPVVLCLRIQSPDVRGDAMTALRRFSTVGHVSVGVVIITGVISMALIEGRLTVDLATPYQRLLVAKMVIVAAMVALAITNRYWLVPRLRRDAAVLDRIRRICIAVFCLGLCAVALVSVFGTLSPT